MANVKITELTAATALAGTDVLPIVDVGADATKKVSVSDLLRNLPDGTASAPALAFADDQNTGVLSPGNNSLAFATSGTQRLVIDSSGKVGIGTTSPGSLLHLSSSFPRLTFTDTDTNVDHRINCDSSVGNFALETDINNESATSSFIIKVSQSEKLRIDNSGRLLVGTTTEGNGNADDFTVATSASTGITIRSGTSNSGNIYFSDGTSGSAEYRGFLQYRHSEDSLAIGVNAVERLRIDSSGNVGIGTTSPGSYLASAHQLVISDSASTGLTIATPTSSSGTIAFADGTGAADNARGLIRYGHSDNSLQFSTNASERMRIDSSGRLLLGHSSGRAVGGGTQSLAQIETTSQNGLSFVAHRGTNTSGSILILGKSRGTSVGSNTVVASGDELGALRFAGADGTDVQSRGGQISCEVDGTPGANDMPGRLVFSTTADGASSPTERMRIDSSGTLLVATTSTNVSSNEKLTVNGISTFFRNQGSAVNVKRTGNNGDVINFLRDTTAVGTISVTASATAYNTSSDYRLKENVVDISDGITRVKQLLPKRFNFIADDTATVDGFLAHEAQTVVPEAVTGTHNEVDDEGNAVMQGIDQSKLVPLLTAALQEAIAKIETLETKVAALEAQ